ncbi:hypothetical protein Glove_21g178 [Diversispora epigaea]|uniref:Protein kinase domain-containing protein n=1 Tax=Diversispora epigaea TaxID=1348612 RepID=A0A397JUS1_9GLOM|nr:hypothetical protein Glove_21g178 [Diversispora epigaea]
MSNEHLKLFYSNYGISKDPKIDEYMMTYILHGDFHPGNILLNDKIPKIEMFDCLHISDFGLSKIVGQSLENSNMSNVFGVLPYIAPEVLCGEENTKAVDLYKYAMDYHQKIPFHTPKLIIGIIMRCWDARVTHRPTFKELYKELDK